MQLKDGKAVCGLMSRGFDCGVERDRKGAGASLADTPQGPQDKHPDRELCYAFFYVGESLAVVINSSSSAGMSRRGTRFIRLDIEIHENPLSKSNRSEFSVETTDRRLKIENRK
jgi:hypothetical protein